MPPVNRLAPQPANSFAEYGPYGPVTSDPAASAAYQQQLVSGLGSGLANQLRGMYQTVRHAATSRPIDDIRGALASLAALYDDPMQALQALREMRQRAMSGPQGLGQVLGELAPLPGPRGVPNAMRITEPEGFLRRRGAQLAKEEADDAKNLADMTDRGMHQANIDKLLGKKDWMSQTEKRAAVVSRLHAELPFVKLDPTPSVRDFNAIARQFERFKDPDAASNALSYIAHFQKRIDADFDEYIAGVREYRKTLNPRSKYDRERIKLIDDVLGDFRVVILPQGK